MSPFTEDEREQQLRHLMEVYGDGLKRLCCVYLRDMGLAVVLVTHDLAVARLLSHRLIVMYHGEVAETGLTDQVLDDPQHPYSQLLVSSILQC